MLDVYGKLYKEQAISQNMTRTLIIKDKKYFAIFRWIVERDGCWSYDLKERMYKEQVIDDEKFRKGEKDIEKLLQPLFYKTSKDSYAISNKLQNLKNKMGFIKYTKIISRGRQGKAAFWVVDWHKVITYYLNNYFPKEFIELLRFQSSKDEERLYKHLEMVFTDILIGIFDEDEWNNGTLYKVYHLNREKLSNILTETKHIDTFDLLFNWTTKWIGFKTYIHEAARTMPGAWGSWKQSINH